MRFFSVLLILAGLGIAFALPIYQTDFAGEDVETVRVFDRSLGGWRGGWQDRQIDLTPQGGPYRIRLEGEIARGQTGLPSTLPIFVELSGPQGMVFSGEYAFGVSRQGEENSSGDIRLFVSLPEFNVIDDGPHKLSVRMLTERDISLMKIDATIVGNAQAAGFDYLPIGLGVFGLGTVLYFISSRRRKKKRKESREEKKSIRWGRQ